MKLTEKSLQVFECIKANGGRVSISDLAAQTGRTERSVGANVTDLAKKELCVREKEEGDEATVTYAVLTDAGMEFVQEED